MQRLNQETNETGILAYTYREAATLVGLWALITVTNSMFNDSELTFTGSFVAIIEHGSAVPNVCMAYGLLSGIKSERPAPSYFRMRQVIAFVYMTVFLCLNYYVSTSKIFNFAFFGIPIADYILLYGLLFSLAFFVLRPGLVFVALRSKSEEDVL